MIKVGLIGCGFMGGMHAACYSALAPLGVKVTAVADVRPDFAAKLADENTAVYATGMELIEKADVDVVDICLPTHLHTAHAVAAMKAGKHVFVEKPVCVSEAEMELLLATEQETGVKVQVGQVIRQWTEYVWLKETVDSGVYGKVLHGQFRRLSSLPTWAWENWLHQVEKSGGVAVDLHVHDVDFINYLLGLPEAVVSDAYHVSSGFDCISTQYFYKDGPIVQATGDWNMPVSYGFRCDYIAVFENAVITNDDVGLKVCTGGGVLRQEDFPEFTTEDKYFTEIAYFLHCIRDDAENEIVPMESTMQTIQLVTAEIEAAQTRTMVYL